MGLDIGSMLPLLIVGMIIIFVWMAFAPEIMLLLNWILQRKKSFIERADDAHVALF